MNCSLQSPLISLKIKRHLDKIKSAVFLNKNAAFLASLMCQLKFTFKENIPTMATDGSSILIGTKFFNDTSDQDLSFILVHELWHVALLHNLRRGTRDPKIFNVAADYVVNLKAYEDMGYKPKGALYDKQYEGMAVEEVYDLIVDKLKDTENISIDLIDPKDSTDAQNQTAKVQKAGAIAKSSGNIPGSVENEISKFLKPKVNWKTLLKNYLTEQIDTDSSWSKPNRRYLSQGMYMPAQLPLEGRLEHLMFFLDTSGSITDEEVTQFLSEIRTIQAELKPKRLTLVQFDYEIRHIQELREGMVPNSFEVHGRGGTSLVQVHDMIQERKPTCAVIFSDLECKPMEPVDSPIIWIIVNSSNTAEFGKQIHIQTGEY